MTAIRRDALLSLTAELVARKSENPPGNEQAVVELLRDRLQQSSISFAIETQAVQPERTNVIARAGDPAHGTVLLTGHMDVVPADATAWSGDPYELREEGGRVIGRGVADMKGALAAKLLAAEAYLSATDRPGEVILAFVVDEEHGGSGTRALVENGITADVALVGEPSQLNVCIAQKGTVRYEITVTGRNAHSGTPDQGADAIRGASRILSRLDTFDADIRADRTHPLLDPETVTVTEIQGGIAPNVVADHAELVVDWRLHPRPADPTAFDKRLERLLAEVALPPGVQVSFVRDVYAPGAEIDAAHPVVGMVQAAANDAGVDAGVTGFNAVTDARFLIHDANIPTVVFGPGSIESDAHTVDESIAIQDLVAAAETYRHFLCRYFS